MSENNDSVNNETDINTKSWILVEATNEECDGDQIDLNLQSVQELQSEDLGHNECTSDSDGISVISESECCTCLPSKHILNEPNFLKHESEEIAEEEDQSDEGSDEDISEDSEEEIPLEVDLREREVEWQKELNLQSKNAIVNSNKLIMMATSIAGFCIVITYLLSIYKLYSSINNVEIENNANHDNFISQPDVAEDFLDEDYDERYIWLNNEMTNDSCDYTLDIFEKITDDASTFNLKYKTNEKSPPATMANNDIQTSTDKDKKITNKKDSQEIYISLNKNSNNNIKNHRRKKPVKVEADTLKMEDNYLSKKDKYLSLQEKQLKKLQKQISEMEAKVRKYHELIKKELQAHYDKKDKSGKKQSNHNSTGEWFQKMHSGRTQIRNKMHQSDWLFERSQLRKRLREKELLYFGKGNSRENGRPSENLRYGKRKR